MIPPRLFLFYYRLLSHHRFLAERRSPLFASNRAAKWTMAATGLLFLFAEHPFSFSKALRVVAHPNSRSHQ